MATSESTIQYLLDQLHSVKNIRASKMFGEYALFCNEKVVALVCNDELFVKITDAGKKVVGSAHLEGFAYKSAKASIYISGDMFDDQVLLCKLISVTADSLLKLKPKKIRV